MFADLTLSGLTSTAIYSLLGLLLMLFSYKVVELVSPFSIRKEIEDDQNVALGVMIGCMMLGIAIIIAATIASPSERHEITTPPSSISGP